LDLKTMAAVAAGWSEEAVQTTVNIGATETVTAVPSPE
jgi:hypothetical protein